MTLPGDAAAASAPAARATWIVGARPSAASRALARRFGARARRPGRHRRLRRGARERARAFAGALRRSGLLVYAQPDTLGHAAPGRPERPAVGRAGRWRAKVVDPALVPPPVTPTSPLIALVDAQLDPTHPEFAGGHTTTTAAVPVTISHGTATASVAAAPVNGVGHRRRLARRAGAERAAAGRDHLRAARPTRSRAAIQSGAAVINMSYGSTELCYPEYVALQFAVARGIVPVAAAGNEFAEGNPLEFPASLPHVLTVAALGPGNTSSLFSNASAAIDLSAPGENIMTAVPPALDGDGVADGYERQSGTSFSAPMVAAAVAWIRAERPDADRRPGGAGGAPVGDATSAAPGWEPDTGFGLLSVDRRADDHAAAARPGRAQRRHRVGRRARVRQARPRCSTPAAAAAGCSRLLDVFEDPADVYRDPAAPALAREGEREPGQPRRRRAVRLARKAKQLNSRPLARSAHRGRRTERLVLRNRSRKPRTFYVAVTIQRGVRILDATYALRVG